MLKAAEWESLFSMDESVSGMTDHHVGGFDFIAVSPACPEAYDIYIPNQTEPLGFVRLRHGKLTVRLNTSSPFNDWQIIFKKDLPGEQGDGRFVSEELRQGYLYLIAQLLRTELR